jgi:hypothetical protein
MVLVPVGDVLGVPVVLVPVLGDVPVPVPGEVVVLPPEVAGGAQDAPEYVAVPEYQ